MKWYKQYLSVYGKTLDQISSSYLKSIAEKISIINFSKNPVASVVVIAHNEEKHLAACLHSLVNNKIDDPIEIIGVDNNSSDKTNKLFQDLGLEPLFEKYQSAGHARQCGLEQAKGKYYICIDSDTLYPPNYIQTIIHQLQRPGIVAVTSLWSFIPDKTHSEIGLKIYEFIRDIHLRILFIKRPELSVRGMVFAHRTDLGKKVGYRVHIIRGEDGAMAHGLLKYGKIKLLTSRKTRAISGTDTLNNDGSLWNSFKIRVKNALRGFKKYFTTQDNYIDQKSNLIDDKND